MRKCARHTTLMRVIQLWLCGRATCCVPSRWFDTCALPCTAGLVAIGRRASSNGGIVVVTWADESYIPMLQDHWFPRMRAAGLGAIVVAGDENTAHAARRAGAHPVLLAPVPAGSLSVECPLGSHGTGECMRRYHMFAYTKLSVPRCLVAHGMEVLAMDADAIMTGDLVGLARSSNAHVATIMDGQDLYTSPLELAYTGGASWGLPFPMRRSIGVLFGTRIPVPMGRPLSWAPPRPGPGGRPRTASPGLGYASRTIVFTHTHALHTPASTFYHDSNIITKARHVFRVHDRPIPDILSWPDDAEQIIGNK